MEMSIRLMSTVEAGVWSASDVVYLSYSNLRLTPTTHNQEVLIQISLTTIHNE